jgi:cell division septal protein FtsQ
MFFFVLSNKHGNKRRKFFDYHEKKLDNPFYNKKKKIADSKKIKTKIIIAAIAILIGFLFWLLYFSKIFFIKNIEISKLEKINKEEVEALLSEKINENKSKIAPQNNLIFFNTDEFAVLFNKNFRFQGIKIRKKWPDALSLEITEKALSAIWLENEKYYYLDNEGYLLGEANLLEIDGQAYPLIKNNSGEKIENGKIGQDPEIIAYSIELFKKIQAEYPEMFVNFFSIDDDINSLKLAISGGPEIFFSTENSTDEQLEKLSILKEEKLKNDFNSKKYIDLRFGDKIYYQ